MSRLRCYLGDFLSIAQTVPRVIINLRQSTGLWQIDCNTTPLLPALHSVVRQGTTWPTTVWWRWKGPADQTWPAVKREHSSEICRRYKSGEVWEITLELQGNYFWITLSAVSHSQNEGGDIVQHSHVWWLFILQLQQRLFWMDSLEMSVREPWGQLSG